MRKRPEQAPNPQTVQPLPGEEVQEKKPSRLSILLRRIGLAVLVVIAVVFAYLFLLLGEPDDDAKYIQKTPEEQVATVQSARRMAEVYTASTGTLLQSGPKSGPQLQPQLQPQIQQKPAEVSAAPSVPH